MAVEAEEEVSTVAGAVASTAAEVGVSIARVEAADIAAAAPMAARGLSTGEATAVETLVAEAFVVEQGRATTGRAGVRTADLAHRAAWAEEATALNPAAIPLRWEIICPEIIRRISIRQSAMGNGIRSATAAIPHGSAADATPETSVPRASPLTTAEGPMVSGILLARPGAFPRFAAALVSETRVSADPGSAILLSPDHVPAARRSDLFPTRASDRTATHFVALASIPLAATTDLAIEGSATEGAGAGTADTATVGGEVLGTATVGAAAFSGRAILGRAGAGEVGALAWDGRTGRTDGIPGGTALTGIPPGLPTTTTRTTPATTIRRRTIPTMRVNTIRGQVTRLRRGWIRQLYISTSTLE
jgi:hypothetical protein